MNKYTVKLVAHAGVCPLTGLYGEAGEETLIVEAANEQRAQNAAFAKTTLPLRGQIVDVYINGEQFFSF